MGDPTPIQQAQQAMGKALEQQATQAAANIDPSHPVIQPIASSVGDFPWFYMDSNDNFNLNTFNYVNNRVAPATDGSGSATLTDAFDNDYSALLGQITFGLSSADQATLNTASTNADLQAGAVVSAYEQAYGAITDAELKAAGYVNKIDYITNVVVAGQWSGAKPPLTLQQLERARNLAGELPDMPASGQNLLPLISSYLGKMTSALPLEDAQGQGQWMLNQLTGNTQSPSSDNGGMQTKDSGGNTAEHVAYALGKSTAEISNDLNNSGRTIEVNMTANYVDETTTNVSVETYGGGVIGWEDFFVFEAGGETSEQYNMSSFVGTASTLTIQWSVSGYSLVDITPSAFQEDTLNGWYSAQPVAQAAQNEGKDVTGYKFGTSQVPYNFAEGGDFGILAKVMISNYPTIVMTVSEASYNDMETTLATQTKWEVSFLGIGLGGGSESTYQATVQQNDQVQGYTITFAPSAPVTAVTDFDQRAYVLGGEVIYPGAQQQ